MTRFEIISATIAAIAVPSAVWTTLYVFRANQFNVAASEFRSAFQKAIQELKEGMSDTLVLRNEFPKHEDAMKKFIFYLKGSEQKKFTTAWRLYEDHCRMRSSDDAIITYAEAMYSPVTADTGARNKQALNLIESLLVFCKLK